MNKQKILSFTFALLLLVLFSSYSSGPPGNYSGAPMSDGTCSAANNGCHNGGTNDGTLALTSNVSGNYAHGQTYQITVSITDPDLVQAGFQLSAVNASGNGIGTFTETSGVTTLLSGSNDPTIINHATPQTANNENATWTINWTAPSSGNGTVAFYAASVAGNGANLSSGDAVYTQTLSATPLPIALLNFDVKNNQNNAILTWKTGTERNFSHFEVEKSLNAKNFSILARVEKTEKGNYSFTDNDILAKNVYFYRLKMMDNDRAFQYSKVVSFQSKNRQTSKIYPSPASNTLFIENQNVSKATILDVVGRFHFVNINDGQINLDHFENGNYLISLDNETWQRFAIVK